MLCPPFTDLRSVQTTLESDKIPIALGAQNCYFEKEGAFTGEVSPVMLAKLNVCYVIVGHSERRQLFGETDDVVNRKVRGGARERDDADRVRGRDARGARGRRHRRQGELPGRQRVRRREEGRRRGVGRRLRADLGDRDRPHRDPRGRRGHDRRDPGRARRPLRPADRRGGADPVRREREARQRGRADGPARDRRRCWSAARRSTPRTSGGSSATAAPEPPVARGGGTVFRFRVRGDP